MAKVPPRSTRRTSLQCRRRLLSERRELAKLVGARYWGPEVFREALRDAVADGDILRTSRNIYAAPDDRGEGRLDDNTNNLGTRG